MKTILVVVILLLPVFALASETDTVYNKDYEVKAYVRDSQIYDKNWQREGYVRDGKIYDKNWNVRGYVKPTK